METLVSFTVPHGVDVDKMFVDAAFAVVVVVVVAEGALQFCGDLATDEKFVLEEKLEEVEEGKTVEYADVDFFLSGLSIFGG